MSPFGSAGETKFHAVARLLGCGDYAMLVKVIIGGVSFVLWQDHLAQTVLFHFAPKSKSGLGAPITRSLDVAS